MKSHARVTAAVGAALLVASTLTLAQNAPTEIGIKEVIAKLEAMGYKNIHDIEKDDGRWEVDATTADGRRVELDIDPRDGSIIRERPDDEDDD
jgi:uncharacterized membrane protein YkoI